MNVQFGKCGAGVVQVQHDCILVIWQPIEFLAIGLIFSSLSVGYYCRNCGNKVIFVYPIRSIALVLINMSKW